MNSGKWSRPTVADRVLYASDAEAPNFCTLMGTENLAWSHFARAQLSPLSRFKMSR